MDNWMEVTQNSHLLCLPHCLLQEMRGECTHFDMHTESQTIPLAHRTSDNPTCTQKVRQSHLHTESQTIPLAHRKLDNPTCTQNVRQSHIQTYMRTQTGNIRHVCTRGHNLLGLWLGWEIWGLLWRRSCCWVSSHWLGKVSSTASQPASESVCWVLPLAVSVGMWSRVHVCPSSVEWCCLHAHTNPPDQGVSVLLGRGQP
jgi:hypothetical protein